MQNARTTGGAALLLLAMAAAPQSGAETLHAPEAIRACLCLDQAVTTLSAQLYQATAAYETAKKSLAALERSADAARQDAGPNDLAARARLARLLDERDAAIRRFAAETTPDYNATVEAYNRAALAFNHSCDGKAYDWSVLPEVQRTLVCDESK